jgi:hypothetical protein
MALSSFIANCFKYLWVSKMKPYVFLKFFMKILNFLTIIDKKHPFYVFFIFETSKSWNCWPFYPRGTMSKIHTFEKRQCDRCRHRSAVKYTHPPPFHSQGPSLPPPPTTQRQLPRANDIGPFGSSDLLGQWRGVPGAQHRQSGLFHSVPPPPSCPVPAKPALPVEKKVSHSRKG